MELAHLWGWFQDLHAGRSQTGWGPSAATHADLAAWRANLGLDLEPWEVRALMALGQTWLKTMAEGRTVSPAPPSPKPKRRTRER